MTFADYPATRFRRLRRTPALRDLVQEHRLSAADLIWPVFIREGLHRRADRLNARCLAAYA